MSYQHLPTKLGKVLIEYTSYEKKGWVATVAKGVLAVISLLLGSLVTGWAPYIFSKIGDGIAGIVARPFQSIIVFWLAVLTICIIGLGRKLRNSETSNKPEKIDEVDLITNLTPTECNLLANLSKLGTGANVKALRDHINRKTNDEEVSHGGLLFLLERLDSFGLISLSMDKTNCFPTETGRNAYYMNRQAIDEKADKSRLKMDLS